MDKAYKNKIKWICLNVFEEATKQWPGFSLCVVEIPPFIPVCLAVLFNQSEASKTNKGMLLIYFFGAILSVLAVSYMQKFHYWLDIRCPTLSNFYHQFALHQYTGGNRDILWDVNRYCKTACIDEASTMIIYIIYHVQYSSYILLSVWPSCLISQTSLQQRFCRWNFQPNFFISQT